MPMCGRCKKELPVKSFAPCTSRCRDGYSVQSYCKACANEYRKKRRVTHGDIYRRTNRRSNMRRKYGLEQEQYELLHKDYKYCMICGKQETEVEAQTKSIQRLSIDHDHTTGKIRGLLCGKCNRALGLADESTEILKAMIHYLDNPPILNIPDCVESKTTRNIAVAVLMAETDFLDFPD